jgi:hypothetical protein
MPRRGVSILEFVGCMSAMIGGVFLGSMYLGVDVKEMAYTALEQARVVDPRSDGAEKTAAEPSTDAPVAAAPSAPAPARPSTEPRGAETRAEETQLVQAPAVDQPTSPAELATAPAIPTDEPIPPVPTAGFFTRSESLTDAQRQALTLSYWDALDICMQNEVKNRVPAIDSEGNWQLFDYLTGRKAGHLKAAQDITKLDARGVDDHVMAYAVKARDWHVDGSELFGRALDLLTDAPTAQLSGPFAQSWQSAATQHRMEERLLAEKHQAVQSYLNNAYPTTSAPAPPQPTN